MKSSNSILSAGSEAALSWLPEEFLSTVEIPTEARVNDLIDLLHLNGKHSGKPVVSSLIARAEAGSVTCASWSPEELHWSSPFSADDWMEFESPANVGGENSAAIAMTSESIRHAEDEAAEIVAQAKKHAQEILDQASQAAYSSNQEAMTAFEQAKAEGYRQGWEKADAESATVIQSAAEIVAQVVSWRDKLFAQSEPMLVEMVKQIARAMFAEGLELDPKALEINLNRVVENAKSLGDLKIYLNPHDADHLDPAWREYQQLISGNRVQIIPSDGIKAGGCFVQGQMGTVDARVETQMKAVLEVFNQDEPVEQP